MLTITVAQDGSGDFASVSDCRTRTAGPPTPSAAIPRFSGG